MKFQILLFLALAFFAFTATAQNNSTNVTGSCDPSDETTCDEYNKLDGNLKYCCAYHKKDGVATYECYNEPGVATLQNTVYRFQDDSEIYCSGVFLKAALAAFATFLGFF